MRVRGFTLVELLVVILVIVVLIGLLLPGLGMLREKRARMASARLAQAIGEAAMGLLAEDAVAVGSLGSQSAVVLVDTPSAGGKAPLVEITAEQRQGAEILDAFGQPFVIHVEMGTNLGRSYVATLVVASQGQKSRSGSATAILADTSKNTDDVVFVYDAHGPSDAKPSWYDAVDPKGQAWSQSRMLQTR